MEAQTQERRKVLRRLDPNSYTVLIGFKGSAVLQNDLRECAKIMGLPYSEFLRAAAQDIVANVKKLKEGIDK